MKMIYLASASPRRKILLEQIGVSPIVIASNYNETDLPSLSPSELVQSHANGKAHSVAKTLTAGIVIAADTVVVLGNSVLGKPTSAKDAAAMISSLSGNTHHVLTGVCVTDIATKVKLTEVVKTAVTMRQLTQSEIDRYVATSEPYDKAGAYGIQGLAGMFVERIDGCYFNVVGLPISKVSEMLAKVDYQVTKNWQTRE